jgi:acetyl esterase/lipase
MKKSKRSAYCTFSANEQKNSASNSRLSSRPRFLRDSLANEHSPPFTIVTLTMHCPVQEIRQFFATIAATYAQIRSVTQQPYPTGANSVAWITNVPYVDGGGPQQQLDLYIPTEGKNIPLVVYVHGGGWEHGDKAGDSLNPNNLQLLWDGYAMASVNYRLAPAAIWPAQIQDCKAAIRWLRAHANQYGYDPNRIAVIGESVGGHLAAMLGTTEW